MGEEWLSEPSRSGMSAIGDERGRPLYPWTFNLYDI